MNAKKKIILTIIFFVIWVMLAVFTFGVQSIPYVICGFIAGWYSQKIIAKIKEALTDGTFRRADGERSSEYLRAE